MQKSTRITLDVNRPPFSSLLFAVRRAHSARPPLHEHLAFSSPLPGALARLFALLSLATLFFIPFLFAPNVAAAPPPRASTDPDFGAIDSYIESQLKELSLPGLALGIMHGDQIVYLKGYGTADPTGRAITPQTPMMLASLAKPITALAIMQLVDAGKLDLDAPVQRYLPWFRVADPAASSQITVRQLLYHTSGLSELLGIEYAGVQDLSPDAAEKRVRALSTAQLAHPVGTTYEYSNLNYQTLGLIIQQVSGQTYEEYVQDHIFKPLGMQQAFTSKAEAQQNGLANSYRFWFGQPIPYDSPFDRGGIASGYLIAGAEDMARFMIPHLNEGRSGDTAVISPQGMAELLKPVAPQGNSSDYYAMDWANSNLDGTPVIIKGGDLADYKTQIILIPNSKWGIVTLINTNRLLNSQLGDLRIPLIPSGVAKILLGQQPSAAPSSNIPLIFTILLLVVLILQLVTIVWSANTLRRWETDPSSRPHRAITVLWHVGFPLFLNLTLALLALFALPALFHVPLSYFIYAAPDIGYLLVTIGALGISFAIFGALKAYLVLRPKPSAALREVLVST